MDIEKLVAQAIPDRHSTNTASRATLAQIGRTLRAQGQKVQTSALCVEHDRQVKVRLVRQARRDNTASTPTLKARYYAHLKRVCHNQIINRNLSTVAGYEPNLLTVWDIDPGRRAWLCGCEYWYKYSRRVGSYFLEASYLCGNDHGQYWAVRIPGNIRTVAQAIDWLTPAAVARFQEDGLRWTARQGDVWLVELKAGADNLRALPRAHTYDPDSRTLTHAQHAPIKVPDEVKAVRAYQQTQLGSNGTRRAAD